MERVKWLVQFLAAGLLVGFLSGCRTSATPRTSLVPDRKPVPPAEQAKQGTWHTVGIAPKRTDLSTWSKFNPVWWFGNVDDPEPPAWFRPGESGRVFRWHLRNPFHNLTFYVLGIADKPHSRSGRYPRRVGNPEGGWNFAVARRRIVFLPYLAYNRGRFDFYLGWRPGGNLGGKINFGAKRPPRTIRPEPLPTDPAGAASSENTVPTP
jgi:hypothetical protein